MRRRRFLSLAAGFAAFPAFAAAPLRWQGIALGAEARLELVGPDEVTRPALADALAALREVEGVFSLYRPETLVSRLNASGVVHDAPDLYLELHEAVTGLHTATSGLFDPTVQATWAALARGAPVREAMHPGWERVQRRDRRITLGPGQQVTFNGIAQGYATDRVVQVLRDHGLSDAFVDLGEQAAIGSPRLLGLADPEHGLVGHLTLQGGAVATSSPGATPLGETGHILHPGQVSARPKWSTVSVEAETATFADGLSTALVHADLAQAHGLRTHPGVRRIVLVDAAGNVRTL